MAESESQSRGINPLKEPELNLTSCIVHFCHVFPGEFNGGNIGWKMFWFLYRNIGRIFALQRSTLTSAYVTAEGVIHGDAGLKQQAKQDLRQAFNDG